MTGIRSAMVASMLAATLSTFVTPAKAILIGDTITATGTGLNPGSATIGAGVEFAYFFPLGGFQFDFGANTLTVNNGFIGSTPANFGDYVFAGFDEVIESVSIASNTGFSGPIVDNFSFDAHSITLDMHNGRMNHRDSVLVFNITEASAPVPEPATAMLVGLGLLGLACTRRRRIPS
jgi:hypothetical protein